MLREATFHRGELLVGLWATYPKQRDPKDRVFLPVMNGGRSLLPVENIHPAYGFCFRDLAQVDLGCLEILVPQDYLGHDF